MRNSFWQERKNLNLDLNLIFGVTSNVVYKGDITNYFFVIQYSKNNKIY